MVGKGGHRGFGYLRLLPSKRWHASYVGPDGVRYSAPFTFEANDDAVGWLSAERKLIESRAWTSPERRLVVEATATMTVAQYAQSWLRDRELKPRTAAHYKQLYTRFIEPALGGVRIADVTPPAIRSWYAQIGAGKPTQRAHAYALLKAICKTAVDDDVLTTNPCRIVGAAQAKRASRTTPASPDELAAIIAAVPVRYRAMIALASWCALRLGELSELRRGDVDLASGVVQVRRAMTWVSSTAVIGTPKSSAGIRDVAIPPHVLPLLREHIARMPVAGRDALLFPAAHDPKKHMRPATVYKVYYPARSAAGRPDLRFHDLRHTGAVLATRAGASLAEVMSRLGHSTPGAAMRYQHAAQGRDAEIAARLSSLSEGTA